MMRIMILGLMLVVTAGCQLPRWRQRDAGPPRGGYAPPGQPAPFAQNVAPGAPAPFPTVPQGSGPAPNFPPPGGAAQFPMAPPVPVPSSGLPGTNGKIEANWQPAEARSPSPFEGRVLLAPPEPSTGEPPTNDTSKKLYPPQNEDGVKPVPKLPETALPVGIPQFTYVQKQVAAGLRPAAAGGLDWLRTNNYRTVLHLRLPGESDAGDKKQAEERGLKYLSLEVSPNLLTKETVDEFFQALRDPERRPLFVYDRDGALAGGLWYLWLRLADDLPDDVARIRARSLGLREDRDGAYRDMWQSTQKYLQEVKGR